MTADRFSREIRAAAESGDWMSAEGACRAHAWFQIRQLMRRGLGALAARLHALTHQGSPPGSAWRRPRA